MSIRRQVPVHSAWAALMALILAVLSAAPALGQSRVDALMASMTLEQKVAQMFLVGIYGPVLNEPNRRMLQDWQPGGAVLFVSNVGNPRAVTALINDWQQTVVDAGGTPMFIATDQEGGVIARLKDGFTTFPAMMLLTATGDVSLAVRTGEAMARELSAVGVNLNLAPVADLYTNLRNPVIGRRSFGSEPQRTGQMLAGLIRGMQAGGVMATAKHFPGHGDTEHDSHTSLPVVSYAVDELEAVEFAPFRWTVAAGVEAMMVAHIWYPALDPDGPLPASLSRNVVTGLLREEMGFTGLIMTDAIEMDAIDTTYSIPEASIRAIEAGVDLVAFGAHLSPNTQVEAIKATADAVRSGRLTEARIDESVRRILDAKARYGLLDWKPLTPESAELRVDAPSGAALVSEIFDAGTTIAYDQNGVLPLIGDRTVALVYPASRPSIRTECDVLPSDVVRWVGVAESPSNSDIARAVDASRRADLTVVFTLNAGSDRSQQALVNALPTDKTIAVALFSPFDWTAFPGVSAYVTTYSPLPESVPSACGVLFGRVDPRGSLPVALDGARDFVNGGAQIGEGVALALIPRRADMGLAAPVDPSGTTVAMLFPSDVPDESSAPVETLPPPTPTPTREPLTSGTRVANPVVASVPSSLTPEPQPEPTATKAVIAALPPLQASNAPADTPSTPSEPFTLPVLPLALMGGVGLAYGALYTLNARSNGRYRAGVPIERCPACGSTHLHVKAVRRRYVGVPVVRHRVTCEDCGSVLRESTPRRWVYTVSAHANQALHARFNGKLLDDKTLILLQRER
ncbi:MAG: beta-N-acetylhexosaminidase [Chloroflexi bacterium]|nr:beta-N-acetylhexosaminidase [Chloroflexota bacterium]